MPPDDHERSELDEALFNDDVVDPAPAPAPRPPAPEQDLPGLDAALFGESDHAPDLTAPTPESHPADLEFVSDLDFMSEPEPEPVRAATPEADSTAVFASVLPATDDASEDDASETAPTRRERRGAAPDRGSGRLKRLGFAALVVLMVAGVGGLAYAALGRNDEPSPKQQPRIEVQGADVTRTTLRPTTSSSSTSTTPSTSTSTTSTTPPTPPPATIPKATARPPVEEPATDPPVVVPPVTDPPPPPVTDPPPPPTTQPPPPTTTEPPPTTTTEAPPAP